jgi:hypothetical protein
LGARSNEMQSNGENLNARFENRGVKIAAS